ncbi:hypothetical protein ACF0H5_011564 [Mactra antiquata]
MYLYHRSVRKCLTKMISILIILSSLSVVLAYYRPRKIHKTVVEYAQYWNRFRKFSTMIQLHNLTHYFDRPDITVYIPESASYDRFLTEAYNYGYNLTDNETIKRILLFHIAEGVSNIVDMESKTFVRTHHPDERYLYYNNFNYGDSKVYTVNGAWITDPDIVASNGVIHVIDRFLVPVQYNKTIAEFMEIPDLPKYSFSSIKKASVVDPALKMATNSTSSRFTVFAPNDSYINVMPSYGQDVLFNDTDLLKTVYWAHVIEEGLLFLPRLGDIPNTHAMAGTLKFQRLGSEIYVSSNRVRARIVEANIPVMNGVIHVIDNLLFYVYRNMKQRIEVLQDISFIQSTLQNTDQDIKDIMSEHGKELTFFLPTDEAIAKLPTHKQLQLDTNKTRLSKMFRNHLVNYAERDIESFQDGETFTTADGDILTMRRFDTNVYVEGGGVRAKITVSDIGCTNGVIHLVSSVLYQRDFTIWDAIQGNNQLTRMETFMLENTKLLDTLRSTTDGPMTVFLISDTALQNLPEDTLSHLRSNNQQLLDAINGSIAHGVILSSTQITDEQNVRTMAGRTITLYNTNQGLYVIGSKVRANVIIEDIWCSNGILHIIDNILHIPTRNILDEMSVQPTLRVMAMLMSSLRSELTDISRHYTIFVPDDEAFSYMPTHRARTLSKYPDLLNSIIRSHIIPGTMKFTEDYGNFTKLTSLVGLPFYVTKTPDRMYTTINNMKGMVIRENIRCTNGIIHVIDTLLNFPFWTVAETMDKIPELKPFLGLIHQVDDYHTWSTTFDINQTLFVPSSQFLTSLSSFHKTRINSERGMIKMLYESHIIPSVSLTQEYLDQRFQHSRIYIAENRYNYTFTFLQMDPFNRSEFVTVDTGYVNLRPKFDLITDGIACSNGIIYIIDRFLNYPLYDTLSELKRQPEISIGVDQLTRLIPNNSSIDLTSKQTMFTVFAPADKSFDYLTLNDIKYINVNLSYIERMEIVQRHIVKGLTVDYTDIMNGGYSNYASSRNMSVVSKTDGFYLKWDRIEARIVRPNILATNGIIHVIDRLLLSTPYQTTTTPATTTEKQAAVQHANSFYISNVLLLLCVLMSRYYFNFCLIFDHR